jgi:hypothetical protein
VSGNIAGIDEDLWHAPRLPALRRRFLFDPEEEAFLLYHALRKIESVPLLRALHRVHADLAMPTNDRITQPGSLESRKL